MAVVNYLSHELLFEDNSSNHTLKSLNSPQHAKWKQDSQQYLTHLNLSLSPTWRLTSKQIHYNHTLIPNLTNRQFIILRHLINNRGKTIFYNKLGDLIWPNNDDFSLWALAQEISRIRKCFKLAKITHPVIHAHRGQGYSIT